MNYCRIVTTSLGFDRQFVYVDMSQNQGNIELNKKEGDDKKKEKSPMTWHRITCDGFIKKKDSKVLVYNQSGLRRSGRTCYFGPQPKEGAPRTGEDNPFDLCDEEDARMWWLVMPNYFGSFFMFFLYVARILLHFVTLSMTLWCFE